MEALIILALTAAVTAALCIWEGFVFVKLWAWFIIPTFGMAPLTIPMAIGLCLVAAFLTHQMRQTQKGEEPIEEAAKVFGYGFFNAGLILFIGWIVHAFFVVV